MCTGYNRNSTQTTYITSAIPARFSGIGLIDLNDYEPKDRVNASFTVLKKAMEIGDKRLKEALAKIKEGDPRYNLISVNKARKDGIHPISF